VQEMLAANPAMVNYLRRVTLNPIPSGGRLLERLTELARREFTQLRATGFASTTRPESSQVIDVMVPPARAPVPAANDRRHVAPARRTRRDRRGQAHPAGPSPQLTASNWRRDMTYAHCQGHAGVQPERGPATRPAPTPPSELGGCHPRPITFPSRRPARSTAAAVACREDRPRAVARGTGPTVKSQLTKPAEPG
jgi:hypothetical protein